MAIMMKSASGGGSGTALHQAGNVPNPNSLCPRPLGAAGNDPGNGGVCHRCVGRGVFAGYFGLPFSVALSIVCIHELLYVFQNLVGDPIVGGWITPAIPLVTTWLLSFQNTTERIQHW